MIDTDMYIYLDNYMTFFISYPVLAQRFPVHVHMTARQR